MLLRHWWRAVAWLKSWIKSGVHASGFEIIRSRPLGHSLETHLERLLPLLAINLAIDVGANVGGYGETLREIGFTGRIASFEPGPAYQTLRRHESPNWLTFDLALGDSSGESSLHVMSEDAFSSLHAPSETLVERFGGTVAVVEKRPIRVERLDALFPIISADIDRPRCLLKTDTQGFDLAVVDGATGILDHIAALQIEVPVIPMYRGAPDMAEIVTRLVGHGFRLLRAFPNNEHHGLEQVDQDWIWLGRQ
jgi:FkbM family methyltransferase